MDVTINGPLAEVRFDRFDLDAYQLFLRCKTLPESQLAFDPAGETYTLTTPARFAALLGAEPPARVHTELEIARHLFDYQRFIAETALEARRYAVYADCGLGKTIVFLEWARHVVSRTGGRVLILSPLQVIEQTREMARQFYRDALPVERIDTRAGLAKWCTAAGPAIGIANYDKLIPGIMSEFRHLAGLVADESSILKSGGGVIKWNLIKSARGIEYKLSCTATPAPNDVMEYASQASFLEKLRTEGEILWTFFSRDKHGNWSIKPHAREGFYRFMASWSIYLRNPAAYGWQDNLRDVPAPIFREHVIPATPEQLELAQEVARGAGQGLFATRSMGVTERSKLSQAAKGFIYEGKGKDRRVRRIESRKPAFVADLVCREVAEGRQVLVWTLFDEEVQILWDHLVDTTFTIATLSGATPQGERQTIIEAFRTGQTAVLIAKARMLGFGMNFQHCGAMIFSGFSDSYEELYQAIRRAYRYGQTQALRVHTPYVPELEGMVLDNLRRKQRNFQADAEEQERHYRAALRALEGE